MDKHSYVKYKFIVHDLIDKINSNYYNIGTKLPSEKFLSEIYSVSRTTIVNALSQLENSGYIIKKRGEGSFVQRNKTIDIFNSNRPNVLTNQLAFKGISPKKIGIIIPCIRDDHAINIISGIMSILSFPNYYTSIVYCSDREYEDFYIDYFIANNFDGIILFPCDSEINNNKIIALNAANFPIVLLDRFYPELPINFVVSNNKLGAELATNHILSLGHTKIAFYSNTNFFDIATNIRYNAFEEVLIRHNVRDYSPNNIAKICPRDKRIIELIYRIINKEITAVLTSNFGGANEIIDLCAKHKILIPRDLSLICFDNPTIALGKGVNMTYVDQQSFKMGCTTARIIKKLLSPDLNKRPYQIFIEPSLIVNDSTSAII